MPQIEEVTQIDLARPHRREITVGIAGYGTVGRATAEILAQNAEEIRQRTGGVAIRVSHVYSRSAASIENKSEGIVYLDTWDRLVRADEDPDIVVEAIGGVDTSSRLVRAAIESGKPVVTANKALIAQCGEELFALADRKGVAIGIEA